MSRSRRSSLARLCGAYLHQDFDVGGRRPEDAVDAFVRDVTPAERATLVTDVESFLSAHRTEASRVAALDRLHLAVDLPRFGWRTSEAFLLDVARRARAPRLG